MCLYPNLIKNRKYTANKKNGGLVPPVNDPRVLYVPIGCQQCIECRKQKARDWQVRLLEDIRTNKNGKFITLTFSNKSINELNNEIWGLEGYELDNEIATLAMRRFLERWRKKYKRSLRHWTVTELGHNGTENIHIHGIVWTDTDLTELEKIWKYGFVWKGKMENGRLINFVNEQTVNYITKYVYKVDEEHTTYKSKILTSPGIGSNYINRPDSKKNQFNEDKTNETYKTRTGHKIKLPIYWRNKLYTDKERESLWLHKLNKEERWICGEKIDVSKTYQDYFATLQYYREKNRELGYGTGEINWDKKEYEKQRRAIMIETRIQKEREKTGQKEKPLFLIKIPTHKKTVTEKKLESQWIPISDW